MKTTLLALVLLLLVATAVAQIQDQGLQKGVDEFAGTIICEQQVMDTGAPDRLTLRVVLDERGTITFSIVRSNLEDNEIVNAPWSFTGDDGILLRFTDGEVLGLLVADTDTDFGFPFSGQTHNLIVPPALLGTLLSETEDIRFRLLDDDEGGDRNHIDGTLAVQHLAPLGAFYEECVGE